jgi:hypothetical protein
MKRIVIALIAVAFVTPVVAQEEPPPIVEASHNAVVSFLKLTEEQVAAWDEMYQDHRVAEKPLKDAITVVQGELDELFQEEPLDPVAIGNKVIERRELGDQLVEVHVIYHEAFVALLDEDQVRRLRFIARADDVQKFIPAFKLFELIRRR